MLLHDFLSESRARIPNKTALVYGDRRLSYSEIDRAANGIARGLRETGVRRGDRVLVFTRDRVETVVSIFGILRAGAVFTVINDTAKAPYVQHIVTVTEPSAMIVSPDLLSILGEFEESRNTPPFRVVLSRRSDDSTGEGGLSLDDFAGYPDEPPGVRIVDLDLAGLIFTSGTKGVPKGIMLTHLNMVSAARSIVSYIENREDDIILDALPLSFDYGLYQVLMAFLFGGTVVIEPVFTLPVQILKRIESEHITGFPVLPTICALLERFRMFREGVFPEVRYISNTGAALSLASIEALRRSFPNARIFSMYGLTECKRVSYLPPAELSKRPLSVGKAMPNCEVWLVDKDGQRLPDGSTGELVVRGSNVALGYWRMPGETEKTFRQGELPGERLLYSGDIFRTDPEGYLYFVGREDDILKCRGQKVSPREIEDAACRMPGVLEAVAVGYPDAVMGHAIRLYLVFREGEERLPDAVRSFLRANLEDFKIPKVVDICRDLPRNSSGKTDRLLLGRSAEELAERPSVWSIPETNVDEGGRVPV